MYEEHAQEETLKMKVFYIQSEKYYQPADVRLALKCAEAAMKQTKAEVKVLLEPGAADNVFAGVDEVEYDGSSFKYDKISGEITTPRKYKNTKDEILISICPTRQILEKIQNSEHVLVAIIIPDNPQENDVLHWLDLNSAIDINTQKPLAGISDVPKEIKRAVGYLKDYCLQFGVNLKHTSVVEQELVRVGNTLVKDQINATVDMVVKHCLSRGLCCEEAKNVAKAFCRATIKPTSLVVDYDAYREKLDDPKWEIV